MDIFSFLPLIVIIGVLSMISSNAQKKKTAEAARSFQKAHAPQDPPAQPVQEKPESRQTSFLESHPPQMGVEGADDCHDYMLPPLQTAFTRPRPPQMGVEGADDCHDYLLAPENAPAVPEAPPENSENALAQDMLRGVIMSEILGRRRQGRRL